MKILSWNIWVDGKFDQIREFLKSADADIVGLQEVKDDDEKRDVIGLLTNLGYERFFACTEQVWDGKAYRHGPAIFSKFPIVHSEKIQLATGDDERAAAYVQLDAEGTIFHVFSTHLIHTHQQPSEQQEDQVRKLLARIPSERTIVMGDFNATPESNVIQAMRAVLTDTDPQNLPTWSVYKEGCGECRVSEITIRLDYIFVSKDLSYSSYRVGQSAASDHLPISVDVSL